MNSPKSNLIPILIALLLTVGLGAAALVWWWPFSPPSVDVAPSPSAAAPLDVTLFERSAYQQLNLPVINNGSLPVRPPAQVGKANPFL